MNGLRQLLTDFLPFLSKLAGENAILQKAVGLLQIVIQSDDAWKWFVALFRREEVPSFGTSEAASNAMADACHDACNDENCPHEVKAFLDSIEEEKADGPSMMASPEVASFGLGIGTVLTLIKLVKMIVDFVATLRNEDPETLLK